jgi:hypothetical protein
VKKRLAVRLYDVAHRWLEALGRRPPRFADSEDHLLEMARRATGLTDFGEPGFREGLRVLLDAYDREARLTPFGRMMVTRELVGILSARLLVEAHWKRAPEVLDATLRRPLFILGLPRTGTTALHFLLARDPGCQVLEFWLAAAPGPRPPCEEWDGDPRFKASAKALRTMYWLDPELEAIHHMAVDGPEECRHLLQQSFTDDTFDSNATIPSYTRWFDAQDMRPTYGRHRDVLKLVGSTGRARRWVLKYPAHIRNLEVVLETYPDACFVWTHRDPARVLPSLCSLVTGWRGLYEGDVDPHAIGRWQLDMWADLMEQGIAKRRQAPQQFYDLAFREIVEDPVGAVRRLYDHFGFELTDEAERRMRAWYAENPQGKRGGHHYRAESFGLSQAEMTDRFSAYTEHFGVEREPEA